MALGQLDFNYFLTRNCLTITFLALGPTVAQFPQSGIAFARNINNKKGQCAVSLGR